MKPGVGAQAAAKRNREATELARGVRFWLNLRESLEESRAHGISLAEARRRLDVRLAAEGRRLPARKKTARQRSAH
jgi:hypothetical protein